MSKMDPTGCQQIPVGIKCACSIYTFMSKLEHRGSVVSTGGRRGALYSWFGRQCTKVLQRTDFLGAGIESNESQGDR